MCNLMQSILIWTLFTYVITIIFVTYVGVYLTYVAVPIIIISGISTYYCFDKKKG